VFVVCCSQSFQCLHKTVVKHSAHSTLDIVCDTRVSFTVSHFSVQLHNSLLLALYALMSGSQQKVMYDIHFLSGHFLSGPKLCARCMHQERMGPMGDFLWLQSVP